MKIEVFADADSVVRLQQGDQSIPSGRVRQDRALVLADRDAAKQIETN